MNKKFFYYLGAVILVGGIPGTMYVLRSHFTQKPIIRICNKEDVITCPDDTTVRRTGPNCEFASCPVTTITSTPSLEVVNASSSPSSITPKIVQNIPKVNKTKTPVLTPVQKRETPPSVISSIINTITSPFKKIFGIDSNSNSTTPPSTYIPSPTTDNSVYKPLPPKDFAGEKLIVKDGSILSSDNKLIYNIPDKIIDAVSSHNSGWTDSIINVIQVGSVAPVIPNNAIPIADLPGKYYLSENSFGSIENCEFSNKIFILDTIANTVTLMYEENNTTLTRDDPRACNSEIFLLTTEGSNLILKYHTIGTNTLCDSSWSEPEKTFYLDVTTLRTDGMKKYVIPDNLSATAEQEEESCRAQLQ